MELLEKHLLNEWKNIKTPVDLTLVKDSKYYPYFLIINGNLEELKKFNLEYKNINAYLLACYFGQKDIMEYLETEKGFDIHIENSNGSNAYLLASLSGKKDIMEYLETEKGFDIQVKNDYKCNAYLMASCGGQKEIMEYLETEKGFDIHVKNIYDNNAYLLACYYGHKDVMEYLETEKGFDIQVKNNYGKNAYFNASKGGHKDIMQYLETKYKNVENLKKYLKLYTSDNVSEFNKLPKLSVDEITSNHVEFYLIYHHFEELNKLLTHSRNYQLLFSNLSKLVKFLDLTSINYLISKKIVNLKVIEKYESETNTPVENNSDDSYLDCLLTLKKFNSILTH